jgi:hypothetical protein
VISHHFPVIRKLSQEDHDEFKASLGYTERPCIKNKTKQKQANDNIKTTLARLLQRRKALEGPTDPSLNCPRIWDFGQML